MDNLTKNEQTFVKEVATTGNATKAAKKAFKIKNDGYARLKGHRLITKDNISQAIDGVKKTLAEHFDDEEVVKVHKQNLTATRLDHMVFPLGPEGEDDLNFSGATPNQKNRIEEYVERTTLTDKDIIDMLAEVNCTVRKIVHGETARHVYFWAADNMARDKALDKVYKLKGAYAPEKSVNVNLNGEIIPNERLQEIANTLNEAARNNPTGSVLSDGAPSNAVDTEAQN